MKIETRQRIEAYKRCIPGMKERVAAAGMMLVIAATMIISATFAWLTLSSSPEVTNINTTIAANGSLEIALVQGNGTVYPMSGRGDSSAVDNDLTRANVTWGNLVNLSDNSYGINNIALRPAILNEERYLRTDPLKGAVYGSDGRITTSDSNYTFTKWNGYEFIASNEKGVRAISAYKLAVSEASSNALLAKIKKANDIISTAIQDVNVQYKDGCLSQKNIDSLTEIMQVYANASVAGNAASTDISKYLGKIYNLYNEFYKAMELQKTAYVELGNYQRFINSLVSGGDGEYTKLTWEELVEKQSIFNRASLTSTSTDGIVQLTGLSQFITDVNTAEKDLQKLNDYYLDNLNNGTAYVYSTIDPIVDRLALPGEATANGIKLSSLGVSNFSKVQNNPEVIITQGLMKRFEQTAIQSNYRLDITRSLTVTYIISIKINNAHITTAASLPAYTPADYSNASDTSIELVPGDKIATDNYGLAIDLWVRTNMDDTYLVLEGETEKTTTNVREQGKDSEGNNVDLYEAVVGSEKTKVYKKGEKYYLNNTNTEVSVIGEPKELYKVVISGYNGENRIWNGENGDQLLSADSTTQGSGSCYIFYADTPDEQARALELLNAYTVEFIDQNGNRLATANMDTENAYEDIGKVVVPLVIKKAVTRKTTVQVLNEETGELEDQEIVENVLDENNNPIYAVTHLERNVVKMITAIVYIDGSKIKNDNVLADASIEGQLNLQFGSSSKLIPANDVDLKADYRTISAVVDKTNFEFGKEDLEVNVTITVDGSSPASASAFFQRAINSTQGKKLQTESFERNANDENKWTMHYTFDSPGEYYLKEVILDGMIYTLDEPIHVSISGFAPEYVSWSEPKNDVMIYTSNKGYTEQVYISFGSTEVVKQSDKVYLVFTDSSGHETKVKMSYDYMQNRWVGSTTFGTSDTYTLDKFIWNGVYFSLSNYNSNFVKTITLKLGLYATVETSDNQRELFNNETIYKNVSVMIYDNADNPLESLEGAVLTYSKGGSSSNTITAPLTWDNESNKYIGQLTITQPGKYIFLNVIVNDNKIDRASDSPEFTVINPNPVSYVTTSQSLYHGDKIQYVPLMNNAYIGPFQIKNSEVAFISAVVTNSITGKDYEIVQSTNNTKNGVIYYEGSSWYINLPTYRLQNEDGSFGDPIQDGEWSVKSISLWDVTGPSGTYYTISDKLVWEDGVDGYDFSALSTVVSSTLNVVMNPGTTDFGNSETPFMTKHKLAEESGMYITLEDNTGRIIPKSVISDIALNLSYSANKDTSYGYKVSDEYSPRLYVNLNNQEENSSKWTVSDDTTLQYVGVYNVTDLTIEMSNKVKHTITPGNNGVPAAYTIRSKGPESGLKYTFTQGDNSAIGKDKSGNVTGTFMQPQTPDIKIKTRVTYTDENGAEQTAQYAIIENFSVSLEFSYKNGKTAPNGGGYTWTTSNYENYELPLEKTGTMSDGDVYSTVPTTLLAGTYGVRGIIRINNSTKYIDGINDVTVYSLSPTIKVIGVNPSNDEDLQIFIPRGDDVDYSNYSWGDDDDDRVKSVKNTYTDYYANVYFDAEKEDGFPVYTVPKVTLKISNVGSTFKTADFVVPYVKSADGSVKYTFTTNKSTEEQALGYIESVTQEPDSGVCGGDGEPVTFHVPHFIKTSDVSTITVKGSDDQSYTVYLSHPVTIRETNEVPPSITFQKTTGFNMPSTQISQNGLPFEIQLPESIGTHSYSKTEAIGNDEWTLQSSTVKKYVYLVSSGNKDETTGTCTTTTYYWKENTYHMYDRTTKTYTQTKETNTYQIVEHLIGWMINGVEYEPGETITVSGQVTAIPVLGELSKTLTDSKVRTGTKVTVQDADMGETTIASSKVKSQSSVKEPGLPSGYAYYDSTNKKDASWVHDDEYTVSEVWTD